MTTAPAAFNASDQPAAGQRTCQHCGKPYEAKRRWARFCSDLCRRLHFAAELKAKIIREYFSEIGRKGAAARKARKAAA